MTGTLLQTKLFIPPTRPSLVPRRQLIAKLNAGLSGKLTLVSAPAGFGKTTLTAEWLAKNPTTNAKSAWLTLDRYDCDPNRFWQYFLAALQTAVPNIGAATRPILSTSPLPPPPALLTGLCNSLAELPHPLILVLDDYHEISTKAIHEGVEFLIENAPAQFHLVIITRADPPFSLTRLRARSQINEIRAANLRFTSDETAVFLCNVMDLPLSAADIAALENRTEGWITGLQLTAVSLQNRFDTQTFIKDFTTSHHYLLEYLAEEVLHQQPEPVQNFLLKTSILTRLCAPLCDAVTGRSDSQAILAHLQRQNLFITSLDDGRHWFRYHQLFAELLGNQLRLHASQQEIQNLHQRAAQWCAEQGLWEPAINHALQAQDWEQAAALISEAYQPLIAQGHITTWQQWLAELPELYIQADPALQIRHAWAAFLNGSVKQADEMLTEARRKLLSLPPSTENQALRGELATYQATIAFFGEEPNQIIRFAEEALAYLPADQLTARARAASALGMGVSLAGDTHQAMRLFHETVELAREAGNPFFLAHALELVADGHIHKGNLRSAAAVCQEIIDLGTKGRAAPLPFAGNGHMKLASIFIEWHEFSKAKEQIALGVALNRQGGIGYNLLYDHCIQARLHHALGDEEAAAAALHQAEAVMHHIHSKTLAVQLVSCAVQYWLRVGDTAAAESWVEGQTLSSGPISLVDLPIVVAEMQQVSLARVRLAQGRLDEVLAIHEKLIHQAGEAGRMARVIEISLVGALAYQMKRETAVALDHLRSLLSLTKPQGYIQIFVEAGRPMLHLLHQLPPDEQTEYTHELLSAFPDPLRLASASMVEPLTPRELDVLNLIAAGLSNKQIADQLIVSLNTVKKHSNHIYSKLEVNGRTQAIVRARELNLL